MEKSLELLTGFVTEYGPAVLKALATLVVGWIVAKFITGIFRKVMTRAKVEATLARFLGNLAYMILMTLVVVTSIQVLGVASTSFIAVIGAAGLAIGLALQGSLANFAAGVMIIGFRPFKAGDYIEAAGTAGSVQEVQIFSTFLKTPDNKLVIVPNSAIMAGAITNYSATGTRRLDLVFGIGYGDDMKKAKQVIEEIISKDARVLEDPKPVVAVAELGDSSVNIVARPWVKSEDYWDLRFDLIETIKRRFDEEGISIPFPQRDVHMIQAA